MTKIDNLLDQLANESALSEKGYAQRFLMPVLAAVTVCTIGVLLVFGTPFESTETYGLAPISVKWGFSVALLLLSGFALWVLGQPGRPARWPSLAVAIPFVPVGALLVFELMVAGPMIEGATWSRCLAAMTVMSPIAFASAIFAMRALAPTNLRSAGLFAGLFGGAVAMTAYSPFCPELGMGYMAVFYCLPILAMAAIGWLAGPKLLRW